MKKVIALVFVLLIGASSFATERKETSKKDVKTEIRTKIVKLLGKVDFSLEKEVKTTVDLIINKKGEIVILDIHSVNPKVCAYIKRKLNYKKVTSNLKTSVKVFKMPLRIVKS